jgi:hemerythrin-like domain-containing protein
MVERTPTGMLEDEHHFISKVVSAMAILAERLEKGESLGQGELQEIFGFMRMFADKCHHGKEEVHLFPLLRRKGVSVSGCPLAILMAEHQRGRTLVKDMLTFIVEYGKGETGAKNSLVRVLTDLTKLYSNHIWKENYLLFPMTDKILNPEEKKDLLMKFDDVEREIGKDIHNRFEQVAEKLEREAHKSF